MQRKILNIFLNALPVILMVALIPLIGNDYLLTLVYLVIIGIAFYIRCEKGEATILVFGFFIMMVSEYFFIKTGVEKFNRNTLLGLMPLWLPFLWAYGFVAIKRSLKILNI